MNVLGIDLGTTYSCVAKCDSTGFAEIIEVQTSKKQKRPTIPSVVSFLDNGTPFVGQAAKNNLLIFAEKTIDSVKREMNNQYCQKELKIDGILRKVSPIEPSACILRHMFYQANKELVETFHEIDTPKAVVTIPAAFNDNQREKTKTAAELAGIEVLALLQEPTAAAIAYEIKPEETILVFDLGGGTLDVSVVKYEKQNGNRYSVLGTPAGDDHLGGKDWDEALVRRALKKVGKNPDEIDKHGRHWATLMNEAENRKIDLTDNLSTDFTINLPDVVTSVKISRSEFETVTANLVQRAVHVVEKAIKNTNNTKIDRFVLVGGSSRMPMIIKTLEREFVNKLSNHRLLKDWISLSDPDYAIAKGAAKYANIIVNKKSGSINVEDKTTRSYGFRAMRDSEHVVLNLIYADDPCEVSGRDIILTTRRDNQDKMDIVLIENESLDDEIPFDKSNPLYSRSFVLPSHLSKGTEVYFSVQRDKDGIIHVDAECQGKSISFPAKDIAEDYIIEQIRNTISKMKTAENK